MVAINLHRSVMGAAHVNHLASAPALTDTMGMLVAECAHQGFRSGQLLGHLCFVICARWESTPQGPVSHAPIVQLATFLLAAARSAAHACQALFPVTTEVIVSSADLARTPTIHPCRALPAHLGSSRSLGRRSAVHVQLVSTRQ